MWAKPVVIATYTFKSMTHDRVPTRAEAGDIANAVFDCTDAVMLGGEPTAGINPVKGR